MRLLLGGIILLISISNFAQYKIPRDTSFTLNGTFLKEQKKRPYITVASPQLKKNVLLKRDIVYRIVNERQLPLDVYYPKNIHKQKPSVLLIFGGGWKSGDKSQNEAMATELANRGYVAVSAEYRLSLEARYPAAVNDLKAAVCWMKINAKTYGIDTSKIAVLGVSAGGQLATLLGTTNDNSIFEDTLRDKSVSAKVHAAIDIDGILAFHHPESNESAVAAQWLGGTYQQQPLVWEEASALNHIDKNTVPFLFINSSNTRFHAGRDDGIKKLDSLHIFSEVHTFSDTPHPFWFFNPWFNPMMDYIDSFLKKVLF
jgi:pectinesterase